MIRLAAVFWGNADDAKLRTRYAGYVELNVSPFCSKRN